MASSTGKVVTRYSNRASKRSEHIRSNNKVQTSKNYTNGWSDYEKQLLLNLLYEHGDSDYEKLAENLPNKHAEQIKTYLRTLARRAQLAEEQRQKKRMVKNLDSWIELLDDIYDGEGIPVDDSLPYHLFTLTKEFTKQNDELSNEIVDFQKAYEYLYTLAIGRKIDVDERTYYFVHSYIDWFLNEFERNFTLSGGTMADLKPISEHNNLDTVDVKAIELLNSTVNKLMPREFSLSYKRFLQHVCHKTRRTVFDRGEEYDHRISLLRAEVDFEPQRNLEAFRDNPPRSQLVPQTVDYNFKNVSAFVLTALFNYSVNDLKHLAKKI